jgi:cyclic-di-GMP phosphodiesterase TipF (flagellum assembly factor)
MFRPGSLFIAFCMMAVVASVATILVVGLGMKLPLALGGGVGGVALIALVNYLVSRTGGAPRPANLRFFELEERIGVISERVLAIEPRLQRIDATAQENARRSTVPLEKEIAELGTLIRSLAEQVQAHELAIQDLPARQAAWAIAASPPLPPLPPRVPEYDEEMYAPPPQRAPAPSRPTPLDPGKANLIRRAIESDGIELHLQPVAALPQRRVIQYSAVPYLRDRDVLMPPVEFVHDARLAGLQPALDAFVLDRSLRVARRLKARERDISLMVTLDGETLTGPGFNTDIAKRLDANSDLASHFVIGFSQEAFYGFGNKEAEILATYGERGFRFALTNVRDMDLDAASLHSLGIRFLRMSSEELLDPDRSRHSQIHPADVPALLRRHGVLLIAEGADNETRVADLLDLDIRAAQGAVFGLPRPVRPEIFSADDQRPVSAAPAVTPERPMMPRPFRSVARRA